MPSKVVITFDKIDIDRDVSCQECTALIQHCRSCFMACYLDISELPNVILRSKIVCLECRAAHLAGISKIWIE